MDIGMNSANFVEGKDNWIYLITDGSDVLKEDKSNGIKVFYDDGTLKATEGMADYYEGYLKDIANKNDWTAFDSLLSSMDFCMSLKNAFKDANDLFTSAVLEERVEIITSKIRNDLYNSAANLLINNNGNEGEEFLASYNQVADIILKGQEGFTSFAQNLFSLGVGVWVPALNSVCVEYSVASFSELNDILINGKEIRDTEEDSGYKTASASTVREYFWKQIALNKWSGDIMGDFLFVGSSLTKSKNLMLKALGGMLIGIAKPVSSALKNYFDKNYTSFKDINKINVFSSQFSAGQLSIEITKALSDTYNLNDFFNGTSLNMIDWMNKIRGEKVKYYTQFDVDSNSQLDIVKTILDVAVRIMGGESASNLDYTDNKIIGANSIITSEIGAIELIKHLGNDTDVPKIRGYYEASKVEDDISYNNYYFSEDTPYFEYNATTKEMVIKTIGSEKDSVISQLLEKLSSELSGTFAECVKLGKVKVLKGAYYLPSVGLVEAQEYRVYNYEVVPEWFDLKGLEVKNENGTKTGFNALGFKAEEILYHNGLYNETFKDKVFSRGKYFFVEYKNFNENLLSLRVPTIGNNSSESKLILGDNVFQNAIEKFYNAKGVSIIGGVGNDTIYGGIGSDIIYGGEGNDVIHGGNYKKKLEKLIATPYTTGGESAYQGESKEGLKLSDTEDVDKASDIIYGEKGNDIIFGGKGADFLYGGADQDILIGGISASEDKDGKADTLLGGEGDDRLHGGMGVDEYIFDLNEDSGNDYIIDSDKRGIIKLVDGDKTPIIVRGELRTKENGVNYLEFGSKEVEGITWKKGKYINGAYVEEGTNVTLLYMNKQNVVNRITIGNFVKKVGLLGEGLIQEATLGIKYPSIFTSNLHWEDVKIAILQTTSWNGILGAFGNALIAAMPARRSDPLILDLDGDGVETSAMAEGTYFDLNGDGSKEKAGWVGQDDGLLVYDRNSDGVIDSGRELFGDQTRLRDGRIAQTGFEALSEFDSNSDGLIDKNDREFKKLKVWQDSNSDGISQIDEIKTLEDLGIESINLASETVNKEVNGNIEVRTSNYTKENKDTGIVAEYLFANDIFDYSNTSNIEISEETRNLLNVSGAGLVLGLQEAMERDETEELKHWVKTFMREKDPDIRRDLVQSELLFQWAGVSKVEINSRGGLIDARKLETLERFLGKQFVGTTGINPHANAVPALERAYAQLLEKVYIDMMVQSHLETYFNKIYASGEGENVYFDLTLIQEAIQEVIDSDYSYGKSLLRDTISAFRLYGMDVKSNFQSFGESFSCQSEELEWIVNSAGRFTIEGSTKDETVYNEADEPIGVIQKYSDNLTGTAGQDSINGHYGNDSIKAGAGDDFVYGEEGSDSLYGEDGNDFIRGGEGDDRAYGGEGNDSLFGGEGNDTLAGESGDDILDGGVGNDTLDGGVDNDTYIYSFGYGNDIIREISGIDKVKVEHLETSDVSFAVAGLNLLMKINSTGEILTVENYFRSSEYMIEKFIFTDGEQAFESICLALGVIKGTESQDTIIANENKLILGLGGDDTITVADNVSDVTIEAGEGNDIVKGSLGNDTLYGGSGNDTIEGLIGDDYLEGESGDDTYLLGNNTGHDTIYDLSGNDTIKFNDISSTEIKLYRVANNLEIRANNIKITSIKDYFLGNKIETINFSDNVTWTEDNLKAQVVYVLGTDNRDNFNYNDGYKYSIETFDNYDNVIGGRSSDIIDGGKGNDYLLGENADDIISGGMGDDKIYGDTDSETEPGIMSEDLAYELYGTDGLTAVAGELARRGAGNDTLYGGLGNDYLEGGRKDDKLYGEEGNDHLMGDGYIWVYGNMVATKRYHNGNDILSGGLGDDYLEGSKGNDILSGNEGDDILNADGQDEIINLYTGQSTFINHKGNDTLDGGAGNDTLIGGMGNDTYIFKKGYNHDEIVEIGGEEILEMEGILSTEAVFTRELNTLKISVGESDQIKLTDYFKDKENGEAGDSLVETIKFTDRTMSYMDVMRKVGIVGKSTNDIIDESSLEKNFDSIVFGEAGDDIITDDLGMDKIYGGAGNDTIYGGIERDVIFGETGNDTLYGGYGEDTIIAGLGNDTVYGGENNDYIEGNEGNDYIDGGYGKDKIYGGTGNDIINGNGDDDTIYGEEGADTLIGDLGNDRIYGGAGNDTIRAGEGNDYIISDNSEDIGNDKIYAGEGDDYIKSGDGDDYIDGNLGTDLMIGGKGADTYVFGIGYGSDTIMEGGDLSVDTIQMTEGVNKDNIAIKFKKYDLIITIKDTNDKLVISDYFRKDENKVELIKFFDGSEMNLKSITDQWIIKGTDGNDILHGTEGDDIIFGYKGNDIIYGYGGDDTLNGGEGNDLLFGGTGNDYLDGEDGDDLLDGGSGDDELVGGAGDDTYVFAKGYDKDVIIEDRETNASDKTIVQINDISPSKVSFMKVFNNLEVYAEGTAARLVVNEFFSDNRNRIDEIKFSDGTIWTLEDIKNRPISIVGTEDDDFFKANRVIKNDPDTKYLDFSDYRFTTSLGDGDDVVETGNKNDVVYGEDGHDSIKGMGGNDILRGGMGNDGISGGEGNDIISGDEQNDSLYGDGGNDIIDGGQGDDYIDGGSGDDLLVDNEGNNRIFGGAGDDKVTTGSGNDYVSGGEGKDIISTYAGNDTVYGDSGNDIINTGDGNDNIFGGDGNDTLNAGTGNDVIYGGSGDDVIDAGAGNDTIYGNQGDDYYYFGKGDGHDVIREEGWGFDKIVFKDNVLVSDVKILKNIFDLIISIVDIDGNTTDSITIKNYFNSPYEMVERILFANGLEWDSFDVGEKLRINGTQNDDTIIGTEYGDLIYAEDGNDSVDALGDNDGIRGGLGNDIIHGNSGDDFVYGEAGSDTLYGDEGNDFIDGGTGNDTIYGGIGDDIISSGDDNDTVYGEEGNDSIRAGLGKDIVYGGIGNDVIYGNEDADELFGQEGADAIYGGEGNDTIDGGADNDFIEGGYGSDILNGGSGDDRIVGYLNIGNSTEYSNDDNDIIHGNDGNDSISGGYGDDEIHGDAGNDYLDGGSGNDILMGGTGNDTIIGGFGDDIIDGGEGNDYINGIVTTTNKDGDIIELSDNDQIRGGAGDDTIIDGLGDTEVFGDSGNDGIRTGAGDDIIHGGEGNDRLYGESGYDTIYGDSGNDELYGGTDSDTLEGGTGNDYLEGGTGEDKYIFGLGFGQDIIYDYDKALENVDRIIFKADITSSMLDFSRDIYNLIIKVKNTTDMITVRDYFKDDYSKIEFIEFADNTLWGPEKIRERVGILYGTDLGEEILGSDVNNLMYGLGGNDTLYGKEGDDIIEGGAGDDYIEGNEGKDDIKGGLGNDTVYGGTGADILRGDAGDDNLYGEDDNDTIYGDVGDDKIYGGLGNDVIYSGKGNDTSYGEAGDDRIIDEAGDDIIFGGDGNDFIDAGSGDDIVDGGLGNDTISLGSGIDTARGGEGNDTITGDMSDTAYGDAGDDSISGVYKAFGGAGNDSISNTMMAYGEAGNDVIKLSANGTAFGGEGDDLLTGAGGNEILEGQAGNDTINGQEGNDLLLGQDGDDKLYGGHGDDRLDGGIGNDYIEDISGNDIYYFKKGDGKDTIYDKNGSLDRISFFDIEILPESLEYSNNVYDLIIKIKDTEDSITIKDYFKTYENQIEKIEFVDGSIFKTNELISGMNFSEVIGSTGNDILFGVNNISGLDGNDTITGSIIADKIDGGLGNDNLIGGLGNDTYSFKLGDGQDVITDLDDTANNNDKIIIEGLKENYLVKRENYNLIISSKINQDKITVINYYLSDSYKIENISFADGTGFSSEEILNLSLIGTMQGESLIGGYGNDIIDGLGGDDYLEGKSGNDTYIFGKGYGNDTIFDESGIDTIKLTEGLSPEEITLRQVDSNLQLVIETTGEILTIKDYYNPYSNRTIEFIKFNDGITIWNNETIAQKRIYKSGDTSDNMIDGSDKSDSIYGWDGNDILNGGDGNDLIFGGYGNDRLTGGAGSDILDGGYGDDTYYISFDNARDLIRDNQGTDTIKFSKELTVDMVRIERNKDNLDIYAKDENDKDVIIATIESYYYNPYWWNPNAFRVENLQFADKTVWDVNAVDQRAYNFVGTSNDDTLGGYNHSQTIIAKDGNDVLNGSSYNDIFEGGKGNDAINGGYGSDTYIFNRGDGKDTINDNSYAGYWGVGDNGTDKIKFGEGITLNDIILIKKGNNLELRIKDVSSEFKDTITVSNYFRSEDRYWQYGGVYDPYAVEQMEFEDGTVINIKEILNPGVLIGDATAENDILETGKAINSIIYGEAGNDTLIGNNAVDTLYGGADSDLLIGNDGNDILYGGTGEDTLRAGTGNDLLQGDQGNDRLEGNFGSDTYYFERGFGIDTIRDDGYSGYWGVGDNGVDKIKFGSSISETDIITAKKGNNLELRIKDLNGVISDKIIIEDYFKRESRYWQYGGDFDPYKIEKIEFSNGNVIDVASLFTKGIVIDEVTENSDVVNMNIQYDGLIFGGKGNDQITGNSGNDKLYGEEGNDILSGGAGDDTLSGGLGDDIIDGGTGNNVIIYNLGEGIDTIKISANSNNILKLGEGILRENVVITREGHNLVIFDGLSTDKVIVENWYFGKKLNEIQFADGYSMDLSTLHNQGLVVRGTENSDEILGEGTENDELHGEAGNDILHGLSGNDSLFGETGDDIINGGEGNDIIIGGTGNDELQGGANDDLYIFNKEDGQDVIYDHLDRVNKYWWGTTTTDVNYYNAGTDTIKFGEGITKEDLWVKLDGNNLQIGIKNAEESFDELSDKLTIKDFKNSNSRIEFLEFSNGVKLGLSDIISLLGTSHDDNVIWQESSVNVSTLDGNDDVTTGSYDDIIDLGRGNDKLNSGAGQDIVHGGEGNDTILTSSGNDVVYGEDGDDTIDGGEGNDSLYGGTGNDTLTGGTGDDLISGGSGKDTLMGNLGSNIYLFNLGDGEDTIKSTIGSSDIIQFGEGIIKEDILFTREGHNLIILTPNEANKIIVENWYLGNKLQKITFVDGTEILKEEIHTRGLIVKDLLGVNQLTGEGIENDVLYGLEGNDFISGGFGDDKLFGDSGQDSLSGEAGNDILTGGTENDILSGGLGNNTYIFNLGDGQDTIKSTIGSIDIIQFGEGILKDDISFTREGHNLIILTPNESNKIIVENWYLENKIEKIVFADDSEILKGEMHTKGLVVKDILRTNNLIGEGSENDVLYGLSGDDTIKGLAGNDYLFGGNGQDIIFGGAGNDNLLGESDNDTLNGEEGNDILEGGLGADILSGGSGNNTYIFNLGDGQDTIKSTIGSIDIIQFGEGILKEDISFTREGHNLIILTPNESNKIVVENWYLGNKLEKIVFADSSEILKSEMHVRGLVVKDILGTNNLIGEGSENDVLYGLSGNDTINGLYGDDILLGGDGLDTIFGGTGNDSLFGDSDNDILFGEEGNDVLEGGLGADILSGGYGDNTYIFNLGDGLDTIKLSTSTDVIKFGEGITNDNITLTREGTNLIIYTPNSLDKIVVENWYSLYRLNKIVFADGTEILKDEIHTRGLVVRGSNVEDKILGLNNENDVLYGLSGNDDIQGFSGNDFVYGGDGDDMIQGGYGEDSLYGGQGNDFINGDYNNDKLYGEEGNDELHGGQGDDILIGGQGDDILYGESGVNTYVFNLGDGKDTIRLSNYTDIVKFGEGITKDNITLTREGTNLIIYTSNSLDKIIVENWYSSYKLNKIVFADGSEMLKDEIHTKGLVVKGTGINDELLGLEYENNVLHGLAGDDIIKGGNYTDFLYGNEGNDTINGEYGDDYIEGGQGNDTINTGYGKNTIKYSLGDGNDVILNADGEDNLILNNMNFSEVKDIVRIGENAKDVLITFKNGETIKLISQNISNIETFTFVDRTILADEFIRLIQSISGSDNNDYISGYEKDEIISAGLGDDTVYGNQGNDIIYGNEGIDELYGNAGDDSLFGNQGNDILWGSEGNDTLDGGEGDDTLRGGLGNDTYIFRANNGNDVIEEEDYLGNNDTVILEGLNKTDVTLSREENSLIITLNNTGEKLTVNNYFSGVNNKVENIVFQDGTIWNKESVINYFGYDKAPFEITINDESYDITFQRKNVQVKITISNNEGTIHGNMYYQGYQSALDNFVSSGIKDEIFEQMNNYLAQILQSGVDFYNLRTSIEEVAEELREITVQCFEFKDEFSNGTDPGSATPLNLVGDSQDNILTGDIYNDSLDGLEGNDELIGKSGNDTYIFGKGYGIDTIIDEDGTKNNLDTIRMKDINSTEASLGKSENNLEITCGTDKLIIQDYFKGLNNKVESIEFMDNVIWTKTNVQNILGLDISKYTITINSDTEYTVKFVRDSITFNLTFKMVNGLLNVNNSISYYDVNKWNEFNTTGKMNELQNQVSDFMDKFLNSGLGVNNWIEVLTNERESLNDLILQSFSPKDIVLNSSNLSSFEGTAGNDILTGTEQDDIFDGKAGNDKMTGKLGNDSYTFGKGYGQDTIVDNDSTLGNLDIIKMKDITSTETVTTRSDNNLILTQGTDKLIVQDYFSGLDNKIEKVEFSDGVVWTQNTINQKLGYGNVGFNLVIQSDSSFLLNITRDSLTFKVTYSFANNTLSSNMGISGTQTAYNNFVNSGKMNILNSQLSKFSSEFLNSGIKMTSWKSELVNNSHKLNELLLQSFQFTGTAIVDTITATTSNTLLSGGAGNDTLTGNTGSDVLIGGRGNDILKGAAGNDVYIYNFGDGQDTITDTAGTDELKMLDLNPLDIIFKKNTSKLEITVLGATDKVTINNWTSTGKIEKINVAKNLSISSSKVEELIQAISTFSANNQGITWETALKDKKDDMNLLVSSFYQSNI